MTDSPPGHGTDPLGTIPLFNVNIPLTPARAAAIRHALTSLDTIRAQRRELDHREHQLITAAREAGATWQQIAATLGYKDRQAAQQRHRNLARTLASRPPSRTRTLRPDLRKHGKITFERQIRCRHSYEIITERHRRASTVVTSNRDASEWLPLMTDPLLAQSAIDRLTSTCHELIVEGDSYRRRQRPAPPTVDDPAPATP